MDNSFLISMLPVFLMFVIIFINQRNERAVLKKIINRRKRKDKTIMFEAAKRFTGKECVIYTFNSQLTGTIKEVTEGAVVFDKNGTEEAVNLDFIVRIREYPRGKNGKKKSVIFD